MFCGTSHLHARKFIVLKSYYLVNPSLANVNKGKKGLL